MKCFEEWKFFAAKRQPEAEKTRILLVAGILGGGESQALPYLKGNFRR